MKLSLQSFARSGLWSVVAHGVQLVGGLALSVLIVRILTPAEFGVLSIARLLTNFVAIASGLALERTVLRFVPELHARGEGSKARRLGSWGLLLRFLGWLPFLWIGVRYADWISSKLGGDFPDAIRLAVFTAIAFSLYNYLRALCAARFETQAIALSTVLNTVVAFLATAVLLWAQWGVAAALWGAAIGVVAGAALLAGVQWKPPKSAAAAERIDVPVDETWKARLFRYSAAFYGIAVLNHVVHSQIEIYFLGHFHGVEQAGYFQLGFVFAQRIIDFLPLALWEVSMAGFSHLVVQEPGRLPAALRDYLVLLYLVLAPVAYLGFAFSGSAIQLLYGDAMMGAVPISRAYFALAFVAAFNAPVGMIVYAKERTAEALRAYLFFALVNLVLDYVLIQRWAATGAIVALATAKLLNVLLFARIAWREVPSLIVPWRFLLRVNLASCPALLWMLVEERLRGALPTIAGALIASALLLASYRLFRVVGPREAELLTRAGLPFATRVVRLLAPARAGVGGSA